MSLISGKIGFGSLGLKLSKMADKLEDAQRKSVQEITLLVHMNAVTSIQENTDGKLQDRYNPKRTVFASNPGDPPNTDTGRLVRSIKFDFQNKGLIGRVGTNLKYGLFLEFGTKDMEPRPWLQPALDKAANQAGDIVKANFDNAIKDLVK